MSVVIRPLAARDEPGWRRLWRDYLAFYRTSVDEQVYAETFRRLLDDDPLSHSGLVAEIDGAPRGIAHYLLHRHAWKIEPVCYLQDLFVDPGARGAGVGRRLMQAVFEAAEAKGAVQVHWLTHEDNLAARRLYDSVARVTRFVRYERP